MPTVNCSPFGPKPQFELASGLPAVGNQLFFYVAGSVNTKQNTYTDSTGNVANPNPIVLNSLGMPPNEIWFTAGQGYKVVYAPFNDPDPPTSPIWTVDNLFGINDTTVTQGEWVPGPTPTFVNATTFTLVGDQTSTFQVQRRVRTTNTGGTIYSRIVSSVFAAVTTVTVVNDSGVLDSGLSAVFYGLISAVNSSLPGMSLSPTGIAFPGTVTAAALIKTTVGSLGFQQQPLTATDAAVHAFTNTGGNLYVGIQNSIGNTFGGLGGVYGSFISRPAATVFQLGRVGTVDLTVSAAGAIDVPIGPLSSTRFQTTSGVLAALPDSTATTFFTPTGTQALYNCFTFANAASSGSQYTAQAFVFWDGTNARIVALNGANNTITLSGANVQTTQTSGVPADWGWRVLKL